MPKLVRPLSETKVRTAKPHKTEYKLFDGGGLFLLVSPSGGRLWRLKYRFDGKEKMLSFGVYPGVSLAEARVKKDEARKQIANGIDPGAVKKAMKQATNAEADTFEVIAREWYTKFSPMWSKSHAEIILNRLTLDLFPWIGTRPIKEIKAPELLAVLRRVESRGALYSAHRIRTIAGQIFTVRSCHRKSRARLFRRLTGGITAARRKAPCRDYRSQRGSTAPPGYRRLRGRFCGQVRPTACPSVPCATGGA